MVFDPFTHFIDGQGIHTFGFLSAHDNLISSMPVLEKQRWELFSVGVANGMEAPEAYTNAGFPGNGSRSSAYRLLQKLPIKQRIAELKQQREERLAGLNLAQVEIAIIERDGQVRAKWDRYKGLCQVMQERAAHYSDPNNEMVRRLTQTPPGGKPDLRRLPGITTGIVIIEMKLLGKTAVPVLRQDTALLREMSDLESEIAQLMGFLKPINLNMNVDARQDNRVQTQNVQIVKMVSAPADEKGQW